MATRTRAPAWLASLLLAAGSRQEQRSLVGGKRCFAGGYPSAQDGYTGGCNWHSTWAFVSGVRGRCWLLLAVTSLSVTFINSVFIAARRGALHCLPCFHQCTRITHTYIACTPPKNREVHPNSVKDWINPPSLLPLSSCSVLLHKLPPTPGHAPISQWSEGQPLRPCHCTGQGPVWFHPV